MLSEPDSIRSIFMYCFACFQPCCSVIVMLLESGVFLPAGINYVTKYPENGKHNKTLESFNITIFIPDSLTLPQ
jgi:hypothetical protein